MSGCGLADWFGLVVDGFHGLVNCDHLGLLNLITII